VNSCLYYTIQQDLSQERSLSQGNPLSPLMSNPALEPFFISLLLDQQLRGYMSLSILLEDNKPSLIFLAYTDDICVLLQVQNSFQSLQVYIQQYEAAFSEKFNINKSKTFLLNIKKMLPG
jgi:hypothetical protein